MKVWITILFLLAGCPGRLFSQRYHSYFERIGLTAGLPYSIVNSVVQDSYGFLWIATDGGLCRYDGIRMETFRPRVGDSTSLSSIQIRDIFPQGDSVLWIRTNQSADKYHIGSNTFHTLEIPNLKGQISAMELDASQNLWLGTTKGWLIRFDTRTGAVSRFYSGFSSIVTLAFVAPDRLLASSFNQDLLMVNTLTMKFETIPLKLQSEETSGADMPGGIMMTDLLVDQNFYWISTKTGLIRLNPETGVYVHYPFGSQLVYDASSICKDHYGNFWISTADMGILVFDPENESFVHQFRHNEFNNTSLSSDKVNCVTTPSFYPDGTMWVATDNGICKYNIMAKRFGLYRRNPGEIGLVGRNVSSVCSDRQGILWIGTEAGLNRINRSNNTYTHFLHSPGTKNTIGKGRIGSITQDAEGMLWITTWLGNISRLDPRTGKCTTWESYKDAGLKGWVFVSSTIDRNNTFWASDIGTGLVNYDRLAQRFVLHQAIADSSARTVYLAVFQGKTDSANILWIGSDEGFWKFDARSKTFTPFFGKPHRNTMPPCVNIVSLAESRQGQLLIGTQSGGLYVFDKRTQLFTSYSEHDGLPTNEVRGAFEDSQGRFWMSSTKGIIRFNPRTKEIRVYDEADGLQSNEFNWGASWQSADGELFFGGINGLNHFFPDSITDNPYKPRVVFTSLTIRNKVVSVNDTVGGQVLLRNALIRTETLVINHRNNDFAIEFTALHFANPRKNRYEYRLSGYDDQWKPTSASRPFASYTNLPPGSYTLLVRGSNCDGLWCDQPAALRIIILPPWWKQLWFKILSVLMLALSILAWIRMRTYRLSFQKKELEAQVQERTQALTEANTILEKRQEELVAQYEQITAQKNEIELMARRLHETDQKMLQFFTNVSHEFKTPLTLIKGPVDKLMRMQGNIPQKTLGDQLTLIKRNAERLLRLVNQLLDIRRVDKGLQRLTVRFQDIRLFINQITELFTDSAADRQLVISVETPSQPLTVWFDEDILEKILYNLLSNALKFTPEGGKIVVGLSADSDWIAIQVADNGIGIPAEQLPHIFDRFWQGNATAEVRHQGTGVGLSLTRDIVLLHKGRIEVQSTPGKGSRFTVFLPAGEQVYSSEEKSQSPAPFDLAYTRSSVRGEPPTGLQLQTKPAEPKDSQLVLVVEDNPDLREFIVSELSLQFRVVQAEDGIQGHQAASEHAPDLILSDVLMPGMSGIELCEKIKTNTATSHIPVVLLTALGADEQRIRGYEAGADDYIAKPFDSNILLLKVRNLLFTRQRQKEAFGRTPGLEFSGLTGLQIDRNFLQKAIALVEKHFENPEFSNDDFIAGLNMSRQTVYRKLKGLTNQSVSDFIRTIRLKKAAALLLSTDLTISEIAYLVGFKAQSHFSKYFREQFGTYPTEFRHANKR